MQGNPFNPNLGDIKGALQSYEKARTIRRKLLEVEPDSLQAQSDLVYNLEKYADIQSKGGDYSKGETNYDEALACCERKPYLHQWIISTWILNTTYCALILFFEN